MDRQGGQHRSDAVSGLGCVTASVGNVHLDRPIGVGETVELHAGVVYTGRTSVHVLVTVCTGDPARAIASQTAQCPTILVAVDGSGRPVEVPQWIPVTMLELQRQRQARVRIRMRKRIEVAMAAESYTAEGGTALSKTLRFRATSTEVSWGGSVDGGRVMKWIDDAATGCGSKWAGTQVITSYIAGMRFCRSITLGQVVEVTARMIHTGPRSIHLTFTSSPPTAVTVHRGSQHMDWLLSWRPTVTGMHDLCHSGHPALPKTVGSLGTPGT